MKPSLAMPHQSPTPTAAVDAALPPQGVRTLVSFLLVVHLFLLGVGVLAKESSSPLLAALAGGESLDADSADDRDLLGVFRMYRQMLWMDLSYGYHLTRADETDVDRKLLIELTMDDGVVETVELPRAGWTQPRQREQLVAARLGDAAVTGDADAESALAQTITGYWLRRTGAKRARIVVLGKLMPEPERFASGYPAPRQDYEAAAWISGDTVNILKKEPAGDTAPAAGGQ